MDQVMVPDDLAPLHLRFQFEHGSSTIGFVQTHNDVVRIFSPLDSVQNHVPGSFNLKGRDGLVRRESTLSNRPAFCKWTLSLVFKGKSDPMSFAISELSRTYLTITGTLN